MPELLISDDDLDVVLDAANPVDPSCLRADPITRVLAEVRDTALPSPEPTAYPRSRRRRTVPRLRLMAGSIAVSVAVAAFVVGLSGSGGGSSSTWLLAVSPAQAAQLGRVAAGAAQQSGPGSGQWLYQRYQLSEGGGSDWNKAWVSYRETRNVQQWTNANLVQRVRSAYTSFRFDSPKDGATYRKYKKELAGGLSVDGSLAKGHVTDDADPSTGSSPVFPQNMPDTRAGILDRFRKLLAANVAHTPAKDRAQVRKQFGVSMFSELELLVEQSTSSRQRAAALQAFAYVPGVRMLGDRKDVRGRTGLAMRYVWPAVNGGSGQILTVIVDRRTGYMLQDTTRSLRPFSHMTPAQSLVRTVYLQTAIVKSMSSLPGGGSLPYHGPPPTIAKKAPSK